VVYVSCDAATFARDLKLLLAGGYELKKLEAFDLFPMTEHVELVALLDKSL
jgi:23S rRNA (uracil1939-C5)-methyltransferase